MLQWTFLEDMFFKRSSLGLLEENSFMNINGNLYGKLTS